MGPNKSLLLNPPILWDFFWDICCMLHLVWEWSQTQQPVCGCIVLHVLHRLLARKCWVGWNHKPWLPVCWALDLPRSDAMILWPFVQVGKVVFKWHSSFLGITDSVFCFFNSQEQWLILLRWHVENRCSLSFRELPWGFLNSRSVAPSRYSTSTGDQ